MPPVETNLAWLIVAPEFEFMGSRARDSGTMPPAGQGAGQEGSEPGPSACLGLSPPPVELLLVAAYLFELLR